MRCHQRAVMSCKRGRLKMGRENEDVAEGWQNEMYIDIWYALGSI